MPELSDSLQFTRPDFGKNPAIFLNEVKAELSKVTWPTRPEIIKLTIVVIGVSVAVGIYLGGLDYIFTKLTELIINR